MNFLNFAKYSFLHLILILIFDIIWINAFADKFYKQQLASIGRFTDSGDFNIRILPALVLYSLMAVAIENFIFQNSSITGRLQVLLNSAFLGLVCYGIYDLTNRAVLENFPLKMVVVDMVWGTLLFTLVGLCSYQVRNWGSIGDQLP